MLALLAMLTLLRVGLLAYNSEQLAKTPMDAIGEAFFNGLRFDLRLAAIGCLPLVLALVSRRAMNARRAMRGWLTLFAGITLLLGIIELDFYREFNQRLNGLVFQYLKEDPRTVVSMIWYGFPVLRHLLVWAMATASMAWLLARIDMATRGVAGTDPAGGAASSGWRWRIVALALCLPLALLAIRGTLRQGAPLRWGDAFTTTSVFANQLGLNATLSLAAAASSQWSDHRGNAWRATMARADALATVRAMLLTPADRLVDADSAAVRRDHAAPADKTLPIRNVVVIMMESFAAHSVGALGGTPGITPNLDRLAGEGLLFSRFFSNGTHTHQGMFASMGCFPNLPGFEYLMQMPEGSHEFSGLPQLLNARGFDNLYVYNGDFAWDNQSGFFGRQGMSNFVGRFDFKNPVVFDPTWGVSDQDMFDRAVEELVSKSTGRPFYALLQTLSNHTPYPLPEKLPVEPVTGHGTLDQHLTAMRYSDWALGRFFDRIRREPFFKETLFVIVGDHGFADASQLTEMNLARFHVPLLLIGPGVREKFGPMRDTVGTQIDIVPTIMGRLGGTFRHQCWGRDLLDLPAGDKGMGVIKPSGGGQLVAIVADDQVLVESRTMAPKLYEYRFGPDPAAAEKPIGPDAAGLRKRLEAFLQAATASLLENSTGAMAAKR
jgi:phosphoglycerol transferase MdoB-like AlkP superfamily enzyme